MNKPSEILDARGLPCPAPVIMVKKALERGLCGDFAVLVDTDAAKSNVTRFATQAGCILLSAGRSDSLISESAPGTSPRDVSPGWLLHFRTRADRPEEAPVATQTVDAQTGTASTGQAAPGISAVREARSPEPDHERVVQADRLTIFVATDSLGSGSGELGSRLVQGLLYAFSEREPAPSWLILVNAGVRLAVEGSPALASLRSLESKGCTVLACGTCLEYYGLTAGLAVGRPCAMDEVVEILASSRVLRI